MGAGVARVLGQGLSRRLHDATARVVLAMPDDLIGRSLVQAQAEWRLVFHISPGT